LSIEIGDQNYTFFMTESTIHKKLKILADAAKYDVSCSSSGSKRSNEGGLGNAAAAGICHAFTEDGRCVSLLKILLTNYCIYDCAYCVNRRSNDVPRAAFTVQEVVNLTINFYRRNYIEGLFLSSGVIKSPDHTMEMLTDIARQLRQVHSFFGYIHMKAIPGASPELIRQAGLFADRLSVNIEIPSEQSLVMLAPEKNFVDVLQPMKQIQTGIIESKEERTKFRHAPKFTPAGQSTQLVIGASPENDFQILHLASSLYQKRELKRVYYSGYIPVSSDNRLPVLSAPPLVRENRLYQADWLMRYYSYKFDEIVDKSNPNLDMEFDPKLAYALRNPWMFPIDINKADYETILRIPGVGVRSAKLIVTSRRFGRLTSAHLQKMGVVMKRAQYFLICGELPTAAASLNPEQIRRQLLMTTTSKHRKGNPNQLSLF
jgi:putative DNA modification/repair radical SAM protein